MLVTTLAVVLVSATCTSAGCLIQSNGTHSEAVATTIKPCCAAHHRHDASEGQPGDKPCPLCQHTTLLGKTGDTSKLDLNLNLLPSFACLVSLNSEAAITSFHAILVHEGSPP